MKQCVNELVSACLTEPSLFGEFFISHCLQVNPGDRVTVIRQELELLG
jgi:hypothetical protein